MHSPAEEVGLMGQRLASRVQVALDRVPAAELIDLMGAIRRMSFDRHLSYERDGVAETVQLLPCPITMRNDQLAYTHYVSQTILECTKQLPDMYFEVPEVRDILRVGPVEEEWLRECWTPAHRETNPVFGRLDAVVDYGSPTWKDSIRFMEPMRSMVIPESLSNPVTPCASRNSRWSGVNKSPTRLCGIPSSS